MCFTAGTKQTIRRVAGKRYFIDIKIISIKLCNNSATAVYMYADKSVTFRTLQGVLHRIGFREMHIVCFEMFAGVEIEFK